MQFEEAFKELERGIKKCPSIFLIYLYIRLVSYFDWWPLFSLQRSISYSDTEEVYRFVSARIQRLDSLDDVRKDLINGLLELQVPHDLKVDRVRYELNFPELVILKKTLLQLESDKRFANFCWMYLYPSSFFRIDKVLYDDKLIKIDSMPLVRPTSVFTPNDWESIELKSRDKQKALIFYEQVIQTIGENSSLLVNLELIKVQLIIGDYEVSYRCAEVLRAYEGILDVSDTILNKNMSLDGFSEWLLNYLKEKMPRFKISVNQSPNPLTTLEDCKYVALQQLDYLYLIDRQRYQKLLKSIQGAWHKRSFDVRKRENKIKKPIRRK